VWTQINFLSLHVIRNGNVDTPTIALNVDTPTIALADSGDILKSTKNSRWSNENVVSRETELIGTDYCSNAQPFERGAIRMGDWFEW
jgi:hypothetical protein